LTELLVVLGSCALLAAISLSMAFTTEERVLRAECTDNLRQIGVGWNIYQQEFNQVMPCYWPGVTTNIGGTTANPWETYLAYRITSGSIGAGSQGPWNLGVLFANNMVPSPKIFYCPSLAQLSSTYSYDSYATPTNSWPAVLGGSGGPGYIRTGYNYYPQLRGAGVYIGGGRFVPKAAVTPTSWTALDTKKSIVTDLVYSYDIIAHRASGSVAGLNALFPDGHVTFQNARSNPQDFDPLQWGQAGAANSIGQSPNYFRYVMSLWQP
jgi:prepilin-type processing-associated H-X9-DG protein